MSWLGYLVLAILALLGATVLRVLLARRKLRGLPVTRLADEYPQVGRPVGKAAIYCYSNQCGPCRRMTPAIDGLCSAYPNLIKLDVAARPAEARRLGIQATPTILLVEDGKVLKALVGANGLAALKVFLGAA